jgi:glycosyltransferase involved in cell wall biosynthesis
MLMTSPEPVISVLTSTLNCVDQLDQCLAAVAGQRGVAVEHLLIDGASTDGTAERIRQEASRAESVIHWWTTGPDEGIYDAWNKAIPHLRGQWIYCLGADDVFADDTTLQRAADILSTLSSEVMLAYGDVERIGDTGEILEHWGGPFEQAYHDFFRRASYGTSIPHQGVFIRRECFERFGQFDSSYRVSGDTEFIARVLTAAPKGAYLNMLIGRMAAGGISGSFQTVTTGWRENDRLGQKYHIPRSRPRRWLKRLEWRMKIAVFSWLGRGLAARIGDFGRRLRGKPPYWVPLVQADRLRRSGLHAKAK